MPVPEILVVAASPAALAWLERTLEGAGLAVRSAGSTAAALAAVRLRRPDLVLVDAGPVDADALDAALQAESANPPLLRLEGTPAGAESALRRWSAAFDAIQDAVCLLDHDGRVLQRNAAMERRFGAAAPVFGRNCCDVIHGAAEILPACPLHRMLQSGRRETAEQWVQERCYEVVADPLRDAAGVLEGAVYILRDITLEKTSRDRAERHSTLLDGILASFSDPVFSLDRDGRYTSFNPAHVAGMRDLYGSDIALGAALLDCIKVEEDRRIASAHLERTLAGEAFEAELQLGDCERSRRWYEVAHHPIRGGDGAIAGVAVAARNVTARRKAEAALRDSEARYRQLFEAESDALMVFDAETLGFEEVNPAALALYGYTREEFLALAVTDLAPDPETTRAAVRYLLGQENGAPQPPRRALKRRKDGSLIPVEISATVFSLGGRRKVLGAVRDIGAELQAQAEIEALNAGLDRMVRVRTAQLEATNEELEAFAYGVSHDLRAPLRAVTGFAEALLREAPAALEDTALDQLRRIHAAALRMGQLIEDLLRLSRLGRDELVVLATDLAPLAREVAVRLGEADPGRAVELRIAETLPAHGDPRLLRVLLENLIGNAWKFSCREPLAVIEVGRDPEDPCGFFVADNGAGFPATQAGKLFVPFQRLHREGEFPGTGIGLALAKRIVTRHGGRIHGRGEPGRGATFSFTLPIPAEVPP